VPDPSENLKVTAEQQFDPKVWRRYANLIADALAATS